MAMGMRMRTLGQEIIEETQPLYRPHSHDSALDKSVVQEEMNERGMLLTCAVSGVSSCI